MDLEAENPGTMPLLAFLWHERWIDLEKDVGEGSAEVGAINVGVAGRFRVVEIFAFRAVEFDGLDVWVVGHACGKEGGGAAEEAGTFAEIGFFVFFELDEIISIIQILPINFGITLPAFGVGMGLGCLKKDGPFWLSPW